MRGFAPPPHQRTVVLWNPIVFFDKGDTINNILADAVNVELNERSPLPYKFDVVAYTKELHADLKTHIDNYGKIFYQKS